MKVQEVKYIADYINCIKFDNGVNGTIELNDLVEKGIYKVLQDKSQFAKVYTNAYSKINPCLKLVILSAQKFSRYYILV
jgi:hypothetical protein